jgi:hypothetical protein
MSDRRAPAFRFSGVTSPNTTQVPDQYLDQLLPILTGAELKVLLYITRRTFGFKKASDTISLSQMLNGITTRDGRVLDSGVGLTKKTLLQAITSLETLNIILRERHYSLERGHEPTTYFLNIVGATGPGRVESDPLGEKFPQGGGGQIPPRARGKNYTTQHTVLQQTDFDSSNGNNRGNFAEGDGDRPDRTPSLSDRTASVPGLLDLATLVSQRRPPRRPRQGAGDEQAAIGAAIAQLARELGDKADHASSVARAVNLYRAAAIEVDAFVDLLYQAKGEVHDRRAYPGNAPVPRNPMAYFFAVVEDRLGLRPDATPWSRRLRPARGPRGDDPADCP